MHSSEGGLRRWWVTGLFARSSRPASTAGPLRGSSAPGLERGAVKVQGGAATEEETFSQPTTRTGTRPLELAQIKQGRSGSAEGNQDAASAQAAFP